MRRSTSLLLAALCASGAAACAPLARPVVDHRGYVIDPQTLASIRPGVDNKDSVETRLGTPSTIANFDKVTWYYISAEEHNFLFNKPQITKEDVLAVKFDTDGLVSSIDRYDLKDGQDIAFSGRETPTKGKELTFLQQMFGNFGRISAHDDQSQTPTPRN
jgi:outer membrane protein assembly factor BamE (lipoprotein component of BamABCDE complex)